jgi:hypothetical protein
MRTKLHAALRQFGAGRTIKSGVVPACAAAVLAPSGRTARRTGPSTHKGPSSRGTRTRDSELSCVSFFKRLTFNVPSTTDASTAGVEVAIAWFKSKSERAARKLADHDRQHFKSRARHFLKSYLEADEGEKPLFYRAVDAAVQACQIEAGVVHPSPDLEDAEIAMAMSNAATDILLRPKADHAGAFRTDAFATVAIAYRRAAGIYAEDQDMRELGTAAVHLLTMATSYLKSQNNDVMRSDAV